MKQLYRAFVIVLILSFTGGCESIDRMFGLDKPEGSAAPEKPAFNIIQMAPEPPPPVQFEPKPFAPALGNMQWRPGYWSYDGRGFVWKDGEFIERPAPTARWLPDRWEKRQFGWVFVPGYWQ